MSKMSLARTTFSSQPFLVLSKAVYVSIDYCCLKKHTFKGVLFSQMQILNGNVDAFHKSFVKSRIKLSCIVNCI